LARERSSRVVAALVGLTAKERVVVTLYYAKDLSSALSTIHAVSSRARPTARSTQGAASIHHAVVLPVSALHTSSRLLLTL